jgi:hypothetical protein
METMTGFGRKQAWLAVRDRDPAAVIEALDATDLGPASWFNAVDLAYLTDDRVLVTPPLKGADGAQWTLVAGQWLARSESGAKANVVALSSTLDTEVQFFSTYRQEEHHRWQRAVSGDLVRAFGYVGRTGEVTGWFGEPDEAERALGVPAELPDDEDAGLLIGEADVLKLAGAWSVDPGALDGRPAEARPHVASVT